MNYNKYNNYEFNDSNDLKRFLIIMIIRLFVKSFFISN